MTDNFDPTTMPESIFVHEVTDYWHNGMIKYSYQCDENWNGSQHEYVRADLCVPRATADKLAEALAVVLPMAKGYAYKNQVGKNLDMCDEAQQALNEYNAVKVSE